MKYRLQHFRLLCNTVFSPCSFTIKAFSFEGVPHSCRKCCKTEIIAESRFQLDPPRYPEWSPVACLSINDCFTSKLLANSDRFMDDSVEARDLIDLAVMRVRFSIPLEAIKKAEKAYEVIRPLKIAIQRFQERVDFREKCFYGLQIQSVQIPQIIDGIDLLASDFGLSSTERTFKEQHDIFNG